jgi:hypothetical protein
MRFHRRSNALLLTATTTDGAVDAVQRVYVTPDAAKIGTEEIAHRGLPGAKQTNGSLGEAVVRLPGDPNGPLLLAGGRRPAYRSGPPRDTRCGSFSVSGAIFLCRAGGA